MVQKKNDQPEKEWFLMQKKSRSISQLATFCAIFCISVVMLGSFLSALLSYHRVYAASSSTNISHTADPNSAVLTYKGNNERTGSFTHETALNTSNVNSSTFGKRVSYPVDGQVYAEPLFVPNLTINGASHNTVFVATEHDSVYAFDADQTSTTAPLWQTSFLGNGASSVPSSSVSCNDLTPEIGITSTPVIDSSTNTMYVLAYTQENNSLVYRLHALDITTGQEKPGSPIVISGHVPGNGVESNNGVVNFDAHYERQRGALILVNGQVYVAFGGFCDNYPYHGWIMGYSYSNNTLQQTAIYNDSPNGPVGGGGIWEVDGVTADSQGNLYFSSGNGGFDLNTPGGTEAGDAFVKLNQQLQMQDYFSPFNQSCLQQVDADLGSGGPVIIDALHEQIGGGKEGRIYVMNNNNMGKYTVDPNLNCSTSEHNRTDIDQVMQETPPSTVGGIYSTPVYWNGPNGNEIYFAGAGDHAKAFSLNSSGYVVTPPTSQTPDTFGFTGGDPVISSNGQSNGILWALDPSAVLRAYDATNLTKELYTSNQNAARDSIDSYVKFSTITVANGEVFVGTKDMLDIFGLNPSSLTPTPTPTATPVYASYNNVGISDDSQPSDGDFDDNGDSYSEQALRSDGINPGDNAFFGHVVFSWPNAYPGTADNYVAQGQTIPVTPLSNASIVAFAGAATNGPASGTVQITYSDGSIQYVTLGFSDWKESGGLDFNNGVMATMTYSNIPSGQSNTNTYLFVAEIQTEIGKTVASVTLPSTVSGGLMHVFAVATGQASQSSIYNNVGTSDDSDTVLGNFDGANSYSAEALQNAGIVPGRAVNFNGVSFIWPNATAGTSNNYLASGQVVDVTPVSNATTLAFLGASTFGNASGQATITYTDGSTQTFTLAFSDWTLGGSSTATPAFGNQVVAKLAYRNTPSGPSSNDKPNVFYTSVGLQTGKTLLSVTLPSTVSGGNLHVFTIGTKNVPVPAYNNASTSDDSSPASAHFDYTNSYSAQALAAVGVTPGSQIAFNGVTFTWPNAASASANNYLANGQVIPVVSVNNATTLAFLGASVYGNSSGQTTITYTDGTTQTFTLGFTDWTRGGTTTNPLAFGNQVVKTTAYRNTPSGPSTHDKPNIFYSDVALLSGKVIQSVTLPTTTGGAQIHIFAISTK